MVNIILYINIKRPLTNIMGTCIAQSTKYVSYELKVNLLTNINGVSDTPLNG